MLLVLVHVALLWAAAFLAVSGLPVADNSIGGGFKCSKQDAPLSLSLSVSEACALAACKQSPAIPHLPDFV